MNIYKRTLALLLSLLLCLAFPAAAMAHEVPDLSQTGSISVAMVYDGETVGGGSLMLYRVGNVSEDDGNYSFSLAGDFADSGVSLEDISHAALAGELAEYASARHIKGAAEPISEDGRMTADGLTPGLYLVTQENAADGFESISPFLVSVPMYDGETYVYDIDAAPKLDTLTKTPDVPEQPSAPGEPILPQTGQINWPVPALSALGMVLFLCGFRMRSRQRRIHEA